MFLRRSSKKESFRRILEFVWAGMLCAVSASAQIVNSDYTSTTQFGSATVLVGSQGPNVNQLALGPGPFFLSIFNRSGLRVMHVSLTKDSALASASDADVRKELKGLDHKDGEQDKTVLIQLAPGTYYLTIRQHLSWTVRLVVNP
jgi:hypothetical protein